MKASKEKAITLIALVVTIILLLILAGVTISTLLGEDGLIQRTIAATEEYEDTSVKEELYVMLMDHDISQIDDDAASLPTYLQTRIGKEIDAVMQIPDPRPGHEGERVNVVKKNNRYYMIYKDENGNYVVEEMNTQIGADGSVGGGLTLATPDSFQGGTLTFDTEGKSALVFSDKIEKPYNFDVRKGDVTIYIDNDMTLTNKDVKDEEGNGRSAINIEPNAKLNLYILKNVTLTVDSGFGGEVPVASTEQSFGKKGGYAGIRVPWIDTNNNGNRDEGEQAELNLHGEGTVVTYGGNAADGAGTISGSIGGAGGGGAGARNWTVIGGKGGDGCPYGRIIDTDNSHGFDGGDGENCGIVRICDDIKVYAYGGGRTEMEEKEFLGLPLEEDGGYPAARNWSVVEPAEVVGEHATGAGGFSAGGGDTCKAGYNGLGSLNNIRNSYGTGGGYYSKGNDIQGIDVWFNQGGMWQGHDTGDNMNNNDSYKYYKDYSGSGGNPGAGGMIYYSNIDNIYSYNGDRVTNDDYDTVLYEYEANGTQTNIIAPVLNKMNGDKFVQAKIFAQEGIIRATYKTNQAMTEEECKKYNVPFVVSQKCRESQTRNVKITEETKTSLTGYGQGVGSRSRIFRISKWHF